MAGETRPMEEPPLPIPQLTLMVIRVNALKIMQSMQIHYNLAALRFIGYVAGSPATIFLCIHMVAIGAMILAAA